MHFNLYVGQSSSALNVSINRHRNDIKNSKTKKVNDFDINHFQLHDFNKINLYIIQVVLD